MTQPDLFTHELPEHGGYRKSGQETSKEAGRAMTGEKLTALQVKVLWYFDTFRSGTDEDLQDYYEADWKGKSTLRARRNELVSKGLLVDSGERKLNRGGRKCIVWRIA